MLAFVLPMLLAADPIPAYSADEIADAKCLAAFAIMAGSNDKQTAEDAMSGGYYYTGKLFARTPDLDLTTILRGVVKGVKADLAGELKRCSAELASRGKALVVSGQALSGEFN